MEKHREELYYSLISLVEYGNKLESQYYNLESVELERADMPEEENKLHTKIRKVEKELHEEIKKYLKWYKRRD